MQLFRILLALVVAVWSALAIYTHNAPIDAEGEQSSLELRCRYGQCEDRDMATLARYRSFQTGVAQDPQGLRSLLLQSPASPELWCDFAEAHREKGNMVESDQAFQHALALAPNSPPVLLRAAAARLIDGRRADALPLFRRIFEKVPSYPGANVFVLSARFGVNPDEILSGVLPPDRPEPAAAFLRFLMGTNRTADALPTWKWIVRQGLDTPALGSEYAAHLLAKKRPDLAFDAWSAKHPYAKPNLVYNPGFEEDLDRSGGPFAWRVDRTQGFTAALDTNERHSGRASLAVRFAGTHNLAFQNVSQQIYATPGLYTLKAWIKSSGLTTDQGLQLVVQDAEKGTVLWKSDPPVSTARPWTPLRQEISIPTGVSLIRLALVRNPSAKIDSKIKGDFWIDDVEWAPLR